MLTKWRSITNRITRNNWCSVFQVKSTILKLRIWLLILRNNRSNSIYIWWIWKGRSCKDIYVEQKLFGTWETLIFGIS